jgi:hypothetical protein
MAQPAATFAHGARTRSGTGVAGCPGHSAWRQAVPAAGGKKRYPKGQRGFEVKVGGKVVGMKVQGGTIPI